MQRDDHEAIACWNEGEKWLANEKQVSITYIEVHVEKRKKDMD